MIRKLLFMFLALCLTTGVGAQEEVTVKTFRELMSDLSARTNRRFDLNDEACALVKVQYPKPGATFEGTIVGDVEYRHGEYWVFLSKGTKRLRVHLPEVPTIVVEFFDFGISQVESNMTYSLDFKFPSGLSSSFYLEGGMLVGSTMGPEVSLGAYFGGLNIELNAMLPMGESDNVYWNKGGQQAVATYKPTFAVGGRIGYGIKAGKSLRITPQAGVMLLKTSETLTASQSAEIASGAYCSSIVVAVKLQYLVSKSFGVSISPEYYVPAMKSEGFKAISEASTKVNGWANGIGIKAAVSVEF